MFEKILPQAENLLQEIIELKNKKLDENLYWNNRFGILEFDDEIVSLSFLLELYFDAIDPTTINRQGGDTGSQYRTGIYYLNEEQKTIANQAIEKLQQKFTEKIMVEVLELSNYATAEDYHQKYLVKNPSGYCHIHASKFEQVKTRKE